MNDSDAKRRPQLSAFIQNNAVSETFLPMFILLGCSTPVGFLSLSALSASIPAFNYDFIKNNSFQIIFCLIFIIYLFYEYYQIDEFKLKGASDVSAFYPFLERMPKELQARIIVPRPNNSSSIMKFLKDEDARFYILAGDSGVGKSTILRTIANRKIEHFKVHTVSSSLISFYDFVVTALYGSTNPSDLSNEDLEIVDEIAKLDHSQLQLKISDIIARFDQQSGPARIAIIIDQSERIVARIVSVDQSERDKIYLFINTLRQHKRFKIVFAVRSDYLSKLIELLPQQSYLIEFIRGLSISTGAEGSLEVQRRFERIGLSEIDKSYIYNIVLNHGRSNSFILNIAGYLAECGHIKRIRNVSSLTEVRDDRLLIEAYIRCILDEYATVKGSRRYIHEMEVILYTIASLHRVDPLGFNSERLALISHLTHERTDAALAYLLSRDLVQKVDEKINFYFLAHDLLSEHILNRDNAYLQPEYASSLRIICENNANIERLIRSNEHPNPYVLATKGSFDFRAIPLYAAFVAYFFRMSMPETCLKLLTPVNDYLNSAFPGIAGKQFIDLGFLGPYLLLNIFGLCFHISSFLNVYFRF